MKPLSKWLMSLAVISLLITVPALRITPDSWALFLIFSVVFGSMAMTVERKN